MEKLMVIRYRCFMCDYVYFEIVKSKFVYEMFKKGRHGPDGNGFPKCPCCKKPVQLISFEEVDPKKGAVSCGNKNN